MGQRVTPAAVDSTAAGLRRWLMPVAAAAAVSFAVHGAAIGGPAPKRGGTLEFAVDAEPPNYDCHANVSFALLHPVAPHYSTLLKFDTANYPQVEGDLAEFVDGFAGQAHLHI